MKSRMKWESKARVVATACIVTTLVCSFMGQTARAEGRKFLVMLATSRKQFGGGFPPGGLINKQLIWRQYFDDDPDNGVDSFAEYWEEISYHDVTITGDVTDWFNLPWRIEARPGATPGEFTNLSGDNVGIYTYGEGEAYRDDLPMVLVDLDGDPNGADNGPAAGSENPVYAQGTPDEAWTPGERFLDLDGDGKWDGLDEANNEMDFFDNERLAEFGYFRVFDYSTLSAEARQALETPDGRPDLLGPWIDLDGNGEPEAEGNCVYLPDTDNDGNPDCCPNGPGTLGCAAFDFDSNPDACPATQWTDPGGNQILDCNGNFIPDACDISPRNQPSPECQASGWLGFDPECNLCGTSGDEVPYEEGIRGCQAGPPNGVPDECEYQNFQAQCRAEGDEDSLCSSRPMCIALANVGISRTASQRCEFHDANGNGQLDVVEPFENFLIMHEATDDGEGRVVRVPETYIADNYPGDAQAVIAQMESRPLITQHNPLGRAILQSECFCKDGSPCPTERPVMCEAGTHAAYNPPDAWGEFDTVAINDQWNDRWTDLGNTKLVDRGLLFARGSVVTLRPDWYNQAWRDRYGGETPPIWRATIPILEPLQTNPGADPNPLRPFLPDRGGMTGLGTGLPPDMSEQDADDAAVFPEQMHGEGAPLVYYDGPVEHDDLPSSKYHWAGDQRIGEITSPLIDEYDIDLPDGSRGTIPANYGQDISPRPVGDGVITAAGPYATKIHGEFGFDAGNVLNMEYLTWRRRPPFNDGRAWQNRHGAHAYATRESCTGGGGSQVVCGFRDYNLDGWLDQGEARNPGTENYLIDDWSERPGSIPGTTTRYPWNRQRLLEDCIEVLDEAGVDFDDWVDPVALARVTCPGGLLTADVPLPLAGDSVSPVVANGVLSGIVLLPPGSYAPSPTKFLGAGWYFPIHNEDGLSDPDPETLLPRGTTPQVSWNVFVNDLVVQLDAGASGSAFKKIYTAHEYLHTWEDFPDLYDYDVFGPPGLLINTPIGRWDIMASGGLVHSIPILKELPCTEWIEPVDLTTVLTPGVNTSVTLPPAEFVRDESYFFLENDDRPGERYYFWSAGSGFDRNMPGEGMLILHTDVGSNPDAIPPLGNVTGTRFKYVIVQADGLGQLDAGEPPFGDAGDPWPGSAANTQFDCDTVPSSQWYTLNACSGLKVVDIVPDQAGSALVTFNWRPTSIPSLEFTDPPGGTSVGGGGANIYQVRTEATDVYGGTWMRFFYAGSQKVCSNNGTACERDSDCPSGQFCMSNISIDPNGANFIGCIAKPTPGTGPQSIDWNIQGVPDGRYVVFADLIPSLGADGTERQHTTPRAGRNNVGNGSLVVSSVDTNAVVASGNLGDFPTSTTFQGLRTDWVTPVDFGALGAETGDHLMTDNIHDRKPILRRVTGISVDGLTLQLGSPVPPSVLVSSWQVVKSDRTARSETWTAVCIDSAGQEWRVNSSLSQPLPADDAVDQDPYPHATTGVAYTSINGEVTFMISAGGVQSGPGDTFTFTTTGITAASRGVTITNRRIREGPTAHMVASPLSGDAPLTVFFDGRGSTDPGGQILNFEWIFGDGTTTLGVAQTSHTFTESRAFTVVLRVTNPINRRSDETAVDIEVTNNSPNAVVVAAPLSGQAPLLVKFNAAQSSDTETAQNDLVFEWDFGDGAVAGSGVPGDMIQVDHFYSTEGSFKATLTVTDEGGKHDTDVATILVGNTLPIPSVSYSGLRGPAPHTVVFNASRSYDADNDDLTAEWIWGDGTPNQTFPITGPPGSPDGGVEHTYVDVGTYRTFAKISDARRGMTEWPGVTVQVTDAAGGDSTPEAIFEIVTPLTDWIVGKPIAVDASLSFDKPAGGRIASYLWNWGDGTPWGTGVIATHAYNQAGSYTIELWVVDDETNKDTVESGITIAEEPAGAGENHPPTAVFVVNPTEGEAGRTVFSFDARASTDEDDDVIRFTWFFGDGKTATGKERTHIYAEPGVYLVRLTVRDEANASSEQTQTVKVMPVLTNEKPFAFIGTGPRTGTAPLTLTFDGQNSYDPDGDPIDYQWFVDGTLVGADSILRYTFANTGSFVVILQVSDGREIGRSAEETVFVTARAAPPDDEEPEQPVPDGDGGEKDSADQRPGVAFCGLGMLPAMFGSLAALFAVRARRRRFVP